MQPSQPDPGRPARKQTFFPGSPPVRRPPDPSECGIRVGESFLFQPLKVEYARPRLLLAGRLKHRGRKAARVVQCVRLRRDGKIVLFGRIQELPPRRELRVVLECEDADLWLRRFISPSPRMVASLVESLVQIEEVPPGLRRYLER